MTTLSRRGAALVESPPFADYIREHFQRLPDAWDPDDRPDGYIALCIAENRRIAPRLAADLSRAPRGELAQSRRADVPAEALGYDAMIGARSFRERLAAFMSRTFLGREVSADNVVVLGGAGSVLELLFYAIADAGDAVLVPTPSYAGFWADLETRDGLRIVTVDTTAGDGFALTTRHLDEAMAATGHRVRALLFTSPDNPLGRVYTRDQLLDVLGWADRRGLHVVFDEVYALSTFGDLPFVSGASLRPGLGDRVHVVWAFSKDFGASGLRCGALVTENQDVIRAIDGLSYWAAVSTHTQHVLSRLIADREAVDGFVAAMRADLRIAHATVTRALAAAHVPHLPAGAGFFVVCDLRGALDQPTWEAEDRLWRRLLDEARVNLTPGRACRFAEPGFFRLCYAAVPTAALETAIRRVGAVVAKR